MIGIGHENDRFAQALHDDVLGARLMKEYARKSKVCAWGAVLQAGLAAGLFLLPGTQPAGYVFLCVALAFLIIGLRVRRDLKVLKLADRPPAGETPAD